MGTRSGERSRAAVDQRRPRSRGPRARRARSRSATPCTPSAPTRRARRGSARASCRRSTRRVASGSTTMTGLIQSNAVTEPAVAGGALLDSSGRVAGIVMTPVERPADDHRADPAREPGRRRPAGRRLRRPRVARPGRQDHASAGSWSSPRSRPADRRQQAGIEVGDVDRQRRLPADHDDGRPAWPRREATGPASASTST